MTSASTVTADASAHIDLSVNGRSQSGTCTTAIQAAALSTGAQLYINNCPMTSASTVTADASAHIDLSVNGRSQSGHECAADLLTYAHIIFRRGDPDSAVSQNV